MTTELESFAQRLKQLRMQGGLSQKGFAKKTGLNYAQYNRYEKGDTVPSAETLTKLADALAISVDYLLEGEEKDAAVANLEDKELLKLFEKMEKLPAKDKDIIKDVIDAFLMKREMQQRVAS